jgi:hypothetical protein
MSFGVRKQLIRFGIGLLLGGGLLLWQAYREWQGRQSASENPEEIALLDLIHRGGDGNPHVFVKDFIPCANYAVAHDKKNDVWDAVYVPMVPGKLPAFDQPLPKADKPPALIMSRKIRREQELRVLRNPFGLPGLIVNKIDPLGGKHRQVLEENYPGIDLATCVIFEEGRQPVDEGTILIFAGLGGVLLPIGVLLLILAAMGRKNTTTPSPPLPG